MTPSEVKDMLERRNLKKNEQLATVKEAIMNVQEDQEATLAPGLTE
jgi:hypothetical protein